MAPVMPTRLSRERAEKAHVLRACGLSWNEIARKLDYKSHGAVQRAVERHRARNPVPDAEETLTNILALRARRTHNGETLLARAAASGDVTGWASLHRTLTTQDVDTLKLYGLHSPEKHLVAVASPSELLDRLQDELSNVIEGAVE